MQRPREEVVQFIKSAHQKTGKTPSIRRICKELGLCKKTLYEAFPGRKSEMCAAAGVPKDEASFAVVEKASQALKEKRIKEASDGELKFLVEQEEEIAAEVKRAQTTDETNRRITEHEFELASSSKGRIRIFSNPQRMLQFAARTIDYESLVLENSRVERPRWDSFVNYCRLHGLDLAKTLFQVAGSLKEYEMDPNEDELHNYLGFKLEIFLINSEAKQKQEMMQAKFEDSLRDLRCSLCGRRVTAAFLEENELRCPCGNAIWRFWCPNCQQVLQFETEKDAFYCNHCEMSFKLRARN